jgi:hypothetical protein
MKLSRSKRGPIGKDGKPFNPGLLSYSEDGKRWCFDTPLTYRNFARLMNLVARGTLAGVRVIDENNELIEVLR